MRHVGDHAHRPAICLLDLGALLDDGVSLARQVCLESLHGNLGGPFIDLGRAQLRRGRQDERSGRTRTRHEDHRRHHLFRMWRLVRHLLVARVGLA
jgi:hypothetical protein